MTEKFELNQSYTYTFSFTQTDVIKYSEVTGDNNPIHLSKEFAAKTIFKKPILHGLLSSSVFSKVLGTLFPGEGTIYLKQSLVFLKPMFVDTTYEAVLKVKKLYIEKHRADIETNIKEVASDNICITGEAYIMNTEVIN